jgi:hypothetical protein
MANNRIWPIGCFQRAGVNQICRLLGISKKTYYYSIDPARTLEQRYGRLKPMPGADHTEESVIRLSPD